MGTRHNRTSESTSRQIKFLVLARSFGDSGLPAGGGLSSNATLCDGFRLPCLWVLAGALYSSAYVLFSNFLFCLLGGYDVRCPVSLAGEC